MDGVRGDLDRDRTVFTLGRGEGRDVDDCWFGAPWTFEGDHLMSLLCLVRGTFGRTFVRACDS